MKKRKITVLSATVLLAIVAFPLLSTAATDAPVRSIESFVLGTSGLQMNLQLDPQGGLLQATVGPAFVPPPPLASVCPLNDYCVEDCGVIGFDISCGAKYYCPDLASNPPPMGRCWDSTNPSWYCYTNPDVAGTVFCDWMYNIGGVTLDSCTGNQFASFTSPSCSAPPSIPNAAAVAAPASFETLPISDIKGSLVCTGCDPVTNICNTSNGAICKTREFVERNIMEEYEGSCTYKYTTKTGQTVTKTITGQPPSCP